MALTHLILTYESVRRTAVANGVHAIMVRQLIYLTVFEKRRPPSVRHSTTRKSNKRIYTF